MRTNTSNMIKRNMTSEPAGTREGSLCADPDDNRMVIKGMSKDSLMLSNCFPPWHVRPLMGLVAVSPVMAYTKVDLQRKCKKCLCATERLSRILGPNLALPLPTAEVVD